MKKKRRRTRVYLKLLCEFNDVENYVVKQTHYKDGGKINFSVKLHRSCGSLELHMEPFSMEISLVETNMQSCGYISKNQLKKCKKNIPILILNNEGCKLPIQQFLALQYTLWTSLNNNQ